MHGLFFSKLRQLVLQTLQEEGWERVVQEAGVVNPAYRSTESYPDREFVALVTAAARLTHSTPEKWLAILGRYLAADLVWMANTLGLAKPGWQTLDYVIHVQSAIHLPLQQANPTLRPARIIGIRYTPNKAVLIYLSPRHLCHLAQGIVLGLGDHFKEHLHITMTERPCLITRHRECWLFIERLPDQNQVKSTEPVAKPRPQA